jgi:hypothetical protein
MDSMSSLKITINGSQVDGKSEAQYTGQSLAEDSSLVNTSLRKLSSDGIKHMFNSSLIYRRKLAKKGRTFSVSMDQNYNDQDTKGYLFSDISFYDANGNPVSSVNVDQQKTK